MTYVLHHIYGHDTLTGCGTLADAPHIGYSGNWLLSVGWPHDNILREQDITGQHSNFIYVTWWFQTEVVFSAISQIHWCMGIWAPCNNIAECMPIQHLHIWQHCYHAPMDLNALLYAEYKEELHAIIRSTGDGNAAMKYRVFGAPLFVGCCVERVPERYGQFKFGAKTQCFPVHSCQMDVAYVLCSRQFHLL